MLLPSLVVLLLQLPIVHAIKVQGNKFVDESGKTIMLRGVSHSGTEYACVQGHGITEGDVGASGVAAIKSWGNNIVRIPLNEDCWLGINGVPSKSGGDNYKKAIQSYVNFITQAGLIAILDLHWTADGSTLATKQDPMPDLSHSPQFWSEVAKAYKNQSNVMFELFNEPFPGSGNPQSEDWECWRDGNCPGSTGVHFTAAGMDKLVSAVRATGATNVIILGALAWSNYMKGWLDHVPKDPINQLGAVWHSYDFNACNNEGCWDSQVKPVADKYPMIVTESGFKIDYVQKLWPWLESNHISYMAWVWNTWGAHNKTANGEGLITNYDGTPSQPWGTTWKKQLASV